MPFDEDPEDGISLFEVMLGITIVLLVAPSVIWWLTALAEIVRALLP